MRVRSGDDGRPPPRSWSRAGSAGSTTCTIGASPPALVGPPHPGLVRPERRGRLLRARGRAARRVRPGRGRPRHVVLLGAVAVLHAGLAPSKRRISRFSNVQLLVTGYDILFFWVARMMMMFGLYAMDGVRPLRHGIAPSGMVRDQHGKKMSKTVGDTVVPTSGSGRLQHRRHASRWPGWPTRASSRPSAMTTWPRRRTSLRSSGTARRRATANGACTPALPLPSAPTDADAWILGRLREVTAQVDGLLEDFQFAKATEALYHFTWDELCMVLELAKPQLAAVGGTGSTADGTRAVLGHVLDALVRFLHRSPRPHRGALPRSPAPSPW